MEALGTSIPTSITVVETKILISFSKKELITLVFSSEFNFPCNSPTLFFINISSDRYLKIFLAELKIIFTAIKTIFKPNETIETASSEEVIEKLEKQCNDRIQELSTTIEEFSAQHANIMQLLNKEQRMRGLMQQNGCADNNIIAADDQVLSEREAMQQYFSLADLRRHLDQLEKTSRPPSRTTSSSPSVACHIHTSSPRAPNSPPPADVADTGPAPS